jgi:hypothetical protein
MTWEFDGTKICHVCGKKIGLYGECDGRAYKLKGNPKVFVGEDCACLECKGAGFVELENDIFTDAICPICKGTGLRMLK